MVVLHLLFHQSGNISNIRNQFAYSSLLTHFIINTIAHILKIAIWS